MPRFKDLPTRIAFCVLFFYSTSAVGQSEEVLDLALSDSSNFFVANCCQLKAPKQWPIIEITANWRSARFWLKEFNHSSTIDPKQYNDEHHPYHHTYLFTDSLLNALFPDREKQWLANHATESKPRRISTHNDRYALAANADEIAEFFAMVTEPLFSRDGRYAFIDLTIFYKNNKKSTMRSSYFATVCVVYEQHKPGIWTRVHKREHQIL